jgi:hypothetical protein
MRWIVLTTAASVIAMSSSNSLAQPSTQPANEINCNDFTKQGPDVWFADGNVHFKVDGIDITYNNSTIKLGMKTATGVDIYLFLESMCGGH